MIRMEALEWKKKSKEIAARCADLANVKGRELQQIETFLKSKAFMETFNGNENSKIEEFMMALEGLDIEEINDYLASIRKPIDFGDEEEENGDGSDGQKEEEGQEKGAEGEKEPTGNASANKDGEGEEENRKNDENEASPARQEQQPEKTERKMTKAKTEQPKKQARETKTSFYEDDEADAFSQREIKEIKQELEKLRSGKLYSNRMVNMYRKDAAIISRIADYYKRGKTDKITVSGVTVRGTVTSVIHAATILLLRELENAEGTEDLMKRVKQACDEANASASDSYDDRIRELEEKLRNMGGEV